MNLGDKIKFFRKKAGLTQLELSCDILSRSTISKIESNKYTPSILQLQHIAKALNIDVSYLMSEVDTIAKIPAQTYNINLISDLYKNKKYLDIIERFTPFDFVTYYYIGMSYYKLALFNDAIKYLDCCEKLFKDLSSELRFINVENLCYSLNSLRILKIKSLGEDLNKYYLEKILAYLNYYNKLNCEIYFIVYNNLGAYYLSIHDYKKTIYFIEDFLSKNIKINSFSVLPNMHLILNNAYFSIKNYQKAIDSMLKCIFFFNYIGNFDAEQECYIILLNCYLYAYQYDKFIETLSELFIKFKGCEFEESYKVLDLALLYNNNQLSEILYKTRTINVNKLKLNSKMDYYFILSRTNFMLNNTDIGYKHFKKCYKFLKDNNKFLDLSLLYKDLFVAYNNIEYYNSYIKYKNIHENSNYNVMNPNITLPHYRAPSSNLK